jgi:glycosyltransferase involved in cell wall biosynthesis
VISGVIPAYNEEMAIAETVRSLYKVLESLGVPFEVIVVNDGSTDATGELAEEAGARVIHHPHNVGYGRSLKSGIQAAQYDCIAITDADGTYPVEEIPRLLEVMQQGYDMVVGERTGDAYREGRAKSFLRRALKVLVEFSAEREVPDINSGLRLFRREIALSHLAQLCDTFSFTTSLTLAFMMTGRFVGYVPIPYQARVGETKVRLFWDTYRTYLYVVQAILYYRPLKIFTVLCTVALIFSSIAVMLGFVLQVRSGFMLGVGGLVATLVIFSLGLLADLLKQIMNK